MSEPPSTSAHQFLEDAPAMLVVVELVVALARGRQQHDVPRPRGGARALDGRREVTALHAGPDLRADGGAVDPDQVHACTARRRLAQRREVLPLAAAAEDQVN